MPATSSFHADFYYAFDDISRVMARHHLDFFKSSSLVRATSSEIKHSSSFEESIVEGNFLVRKAVGSTPTIMGTRLKQYYVRKERFMEIVLDCGSSQVAEEVIKLSLGYAKRLL